jgi:hypothetical protein
MSQSISFLICKKEIIITTKELPLAEYLLWVSGENHPTECLAT